MTASLRRVAALATVALLGLAAAATPAAAATDDEYAFELLAKAAPDECFDGVGKPYPAGPPCAQGQAKVSQAYVWGLTRVGGDIWFGTGANVNCLVSGATLDNLDPVLNSDYVCEYAESQTVRDDPDWPAELGDQRPPEVWLYHAHTRRKVNKSAEIRDKTPGDAERLRTTIGLRAA